MQSIKFIIILFSLFLSCIQSRPPARNILLAPLFTEHMVLQCDTEIPVWGAAEPGGVIIVKFEGQTKTAIANKQGKWQLELDALKAGGPFPFLVYGQDTIKFTDVLIGEVWLCSGQSNMEWQVRNSKNARFEIGNANWPEIRMFTVQRKVSQEALVRCEGEWVKCSPEAVGDFSAVGYFYGRELYRQLNAPVGLIHSSWGGTPAEAWTKYETLKSDSMLLPIITRYENDLKTYPVRKSEYERELKKVKEEGRLMPLFQQDKSNKGIVKGWAKSGFNDHDWPEVNVPGFWENSEEMQIDGVVWFRKDIKISKAWAGKELTLSLGAIDDFDIAYFNGVEVGRTGEETPDFWIHPRKYTIPANLAKAGNAVIAVRVFDHYGQGGFAGPGRAMNLSMTSDKYQLPLAGKWKFKIETAMDPFAISGPGGNGYPPEPMGPGHSHSPSGLYNSMIYPLAPYAIKGAIWYQGETNAGRAYQYRKLLPAMINDWRVLWGQGDFPFGIVQLANFMRISENPKPSAWAELREAQLLTVQNDSNNGLATIIDIGDADDIHPKNKQDVGKRLSLWAMAKVYNKKIAYSGPVYKSMKIENNKIRIYFDHALGLTLSDKRDLTGFSIAGEKDVFVWAKAEIDGESVLVWSDAIRQPLAVRYAWADNPQCNLMNDIGLPAVPFRTDVWPGETYNNK